MTTAVTDIASWLAAQLDADEAAARAAMGAESRYDSSISAAQEFLELATQEGASGAAADHFERHDPARVLATVAALRRVVELHEMMPVRPHYSGAGYVDGCCATCTAGGEYGGPTDDGQPNPCPTLRALAVIWADAPGWQEAWR